MFENFTRRHRLDHYESDLRYEFVPPAFRYDLYKMVSEECHKQEHSILEYCLYRGAAISVNADYFRLQSVDDIQEYYSPDLFVDLLLSSKWHEILSIIEFLVNEGPLTAKAINKLLEYHNVGYEVGQEKHEVARVVVKYAALIQETESVLELGIPYQPVIDSISAARKALIDPQNIDVAASVSHSVAAVEGYLRGWLEAKSVKAATLGDAIKMLKKLPSCPVHIVAALEQFYIYRNRTENVGHGSPQYGELTREDALLCNEMAISFINYFFRKGAGSGSIAGTAAAP